MERDWDAGNVVSVERRRTKRGREYMVVRLAGWSKAYIDRGGKLAEAEVRVGDQVVVFYRANRRPQVMAVTVLEAARGGDEPEEVRA